MIIKGLTDENYKVLNKNILHLTEEPLVNEVHFAFDNDTEENQTSNIPFHGTQETPFGTQETPLWRESEKSVLAKVTTRQGIWWY